MVKIRLMRIGTNKRPFYRVVAVDERRKRTGAYLELLGTYNPLTTPHEIKLNQDKIDAWVKKGAVLSDGFLRIIGKAPQRLPRKPKKEKAPSTVTAEPKVEESQPAESTNVESAVEAQAEEPKMQDETISDEAIKVEEKTVEDKQTPEDKVETPKEETPVVAEESK